MGITWRAMPLLSTLAALVIIVHSAEEDRERGLDRAYQYDVRERALDTGTSSNEQAWRVVETEPIMQKSTQDIWEDSPERPLRRRKMGRKRKRRPHASEEHPEEHRREPIDFDEAEVIHPYAQASEDTHVVQRYRETDEPLRYRDTQYNPEPTTEMARRRRKRPENRRNRWADDYLDIDRPSRRRAQRRKRPVDNPVKLTEFGEFRANEETPQLTDYVVLPEPDEPYPVQETLVTNPSHPIRLDKAEKVDYMHLQDKSLSEFSDEAIVSHGKSSSEEDNSKQNNKDDPAQSISKTTANIPSDRGSKLVEKIRGNRPIDPVTLKEILKRSNGTSLSEILQRHNLSLSDLLRGKEEVMSMTKNAKLSEKPVYAPNKENNEEPNQLTQDQKTTDTLQEIKEVLAVSDDLPGNNKSNRVLETNTNKPKDLESNYTNINRSNYSESQGTGTNASERNDHGKENEPVIPSKRSSSGNRRKLRLRSSMNSTHKSQLNRDLIAQTARKYHNSRNITKSKEWKYIVPIMNSPNYSEMQNSDEITNAMTTTSMTEETTTIQNTEYYNPLTTELSQTETDEDEEEKSTTVYVTIAQEAITQDTTTPDVTTTTEKPRVTRLRPNASRVGLRRQAFNNRLKRKRMKQKNSTTEQPVDRDGLDFLGMPNLVSSSEFIARTQTPRPANIKNEEYFSTLDDFMTTERSKHAESGPRFTRNSSIIIREDEPVNVATTLRSVITTEETAKFEIEEILNDTRTSARLSKILMERNMTLNELVEHRERGSSHVHLADIFHNASKEPNPPEPFLSKSSIEPISKETYPLRAILEANLHDSAANGKTNDPMPPQTYAGNIPVVMDFGNNVNENGENMGIMSIFDKFTDDINTIKESIVREDSEGTPYVTTVITINNTDTNDTTARESRVLKNEENNLKHDVVAWSELFKLMKKHQQNDTDEMTAFDKGGPLKHQIVQDTDGDGLIVLEDLQRITDFETKNEVKLHINSYDADAPIPGILDRPPSHTRSVTVATASIVGLAMILFLLTYAAFKWKQQRNKLRKKQNFTDERIPTPVFENRKGHKHNLSTRSISPMLATSNIYTLNTLDSNGKESPDYMWDSLRKPFQ